MLQCMRSIQFSEAQISQILDIVAGILNLGNIQFAEHNDGVSPTVESKHFFLKAAELLGCDVTQLVKAMTTKVAVINKEKIESALTLQQSFLARDTIAKHLYG